MIWIEKVTVRSTRIKSDSIFSRCCIDLVINCDIVWTEAAVRTVVDAVDWFIVGGARFRSTPPFYRRCVSFWRNCGLNTVQWTRQVKHTNTSYLWLQWRGTSLEYRSGCVYGKAHPVTRICTDTRIHSPKSDLELALIWKKLTRPCPRDIATAFFYPRG